MLARLRTIEARLLPHGVFDVVRQVVLFAAAFWGYRFVRGAVDGRAADAFQHGRELIALERTLHTFVEPAIQGWASGKTWLIDACSWLYMNSQFTITLGALVFIYLFHNSAFYFVRNMFMVAMGLALVGYLLFPTAPPRLFPEWGFTDSVSNFTHIPQDSVTVNALFNPFAAVPSMHVAFALMLGWPLTRLVHNPVLRALCFAWPFVVTFVVVATGNHFVMDVVAGAVVAAISAYVAELLARARPRAWGFAEFGAGAAA